MKLASIDDAREGYAWTIRKLSRRDLPARDANALGVLLSGVVRAIEGSELAVQVEELRRAVGLDQKGRKT